MRNPEERWCEDVGFRAKDYKSINGLTFAIPPDRSTICLTRDCHEEQVPTATEQEGVDTA
jgi:Zn-finger domain-containing protein